MKNILLSIFAICLGISSYAQYEGFENWTTDSVLTLDDYQTSVNDKGIEGTLATYPVTDPITGTYSIKLETILGSNNDTIFGYFLSGDPDTQAPGQEVTIGVVDSIVGWYKCDIMTGDSAGIICMTTFSSSPSGGGIYYFTGTQSTWKRFAFYVGAPAADSMMLAGATGDPMNNYYGIPGTWIQFDDIQLKNSTSSMNVLNYSFENWSPASWEEPNGWTTGNTWAIGQPVMPIVKTTDNHSGNYALELTLLQNAQGDTIWGAATNGNCTYNGTAGGQPFSVSPSSVECYYKYAPSVNYTSSFLI